MSKKKTTKKKKVAKKKTVKKTEKVKVKSRARDLQDRAKAVHAKVLKTKDGHGFIKLECRPLMNRALYIEKTGDEMADTMVAMEIVHVLQESLRCM